MTHSAPPQRSQTQHHAVRRRRPRRARRVGFGLRPHAHDPVQDRQADGYVPPHALSTAPLRRQHLPARPLLAASSLTPAPLSAHAAATQRAAGDAGDDIDYEGELSKMEAEAKKRLEEKIEELKKSQ